MYGVFGPMVDPSGVNAHEADTTLTEDHSGIRRIEPMIRSLLTAVAVSLFAFPSFAQDGCTSVGCGASGCAETGCGEATPAPPWMGDLSTELALS